MAGESKTTTDHEAIKRWVEERGGHPATVKGTGDGDEAGVLRIDFPGYSGEGRLEPIPWEEFFDKFEESKLAFLCQDETSGGPESRFFKFVRREGAGSRERSKGRSQNSSQSRSQSKSQSKSQSRSKKK